MQDAIVLKGVQKHYPDFTLKVDLRLPTGAMMGLIGENGAGKSTTMKLILCMMRPDAGSIQVLGMNPNEQEQEIKQRIGFVMDENHFHPGLKPMEIGRMMQGIYRRWDMRAFEKALREFDLPARKTVQTFSRGMKMKLSIAVALSHQAELLLLDEPTSGLDPVARDEILEILQTYMQDERHSILFSSHITSDLEKTADYITFLHEGNVICSDEKDALLRRYGMIACSRAELETIDRAAVIGVRAHAFGAQAMVDRTRYTGRHTVEPVNLETMMLFYTRGREQ